MTQLIGTFSESGAHNPLAPFLEIGAHLLVKLGGIATLLFEGCKVRRHTEDTLLDDRSRVRPHHFKVGTVVPGIYQGEVSGINFCWYDRSGSTGDLSCNGSDTRYRCHLRTTDLGAMPW